MDKNMKFQAMEHMLEQKDADAKLAAGNCAHGRYL